MHLFPGAIGLTTLLLLLGTYHYVRSWWGRALWILVIGGASLLGHAALAVHVVLIAIMCIMQVRMSLRPPSRDDFEFQEEAGKIVVINKRTNQILVYASQNAMPLWVQAAYLRYKRGG